MIKGLSQSFYLGNESLGKNLDPCSRALCFVLFCFIFLICARRFMTLGKWLILTFWMGLLALQSEDKPGSDKWSKKTHFAAALQVLGCLRAWVHCNWHPTCLRCSPSPLPSLCYHIPPKCLFNPAVLPLVLWSLLQWHAVYPNISILFGHNNNRKSTVWQKAPVH